MRVYHRGKVKQKWGEVSQESETIIQELILALQGWEIKKNISNLKQKNKVNVLITKKFKSLTDIVIKIRYEK